MRNPNTTTAVIVPLRPELRDATRIPAEIAKRLTIIVGKLGIERWPSHGRPLVRDWMAGKAPATWDAWRMFQEIEQTARLHVIAADRKAVRPMVEIDGQWQPAALTMREQAVLADAQRALDASAKRSLNEGRTKRAAHSGGGMKLAPEFEAQLIDAIAVKAVERGIQPVPKKLPANVVRLPMLKKKRRARVASAGRPNGHGPRAA